jgi:hypothetical protein
MTEEGWDEALPDKKVGADKKKSGADKKAGGNADKKAGSEKKESSSKETWEGEELLINTEWLVEGDMGR